MIEKLLIPLFFVSTACFGAELDRYFCCLEALEKPYGQYHHGEIEILVEEKCIFEAQTIQKERLLAKGFSEEYATAYSRIGVICEDQYLLMLRDAVRFPQGAIGSYDRLIWKSEIGRKHPGVAILPILPDGKILLTLNYRHATRSWELELPRGGISLTETKEEAAVREVQEEMGCLITHLCPIGEMTPDSGILSSIIPIFLAEVSLPEKATPEESEAIEGSIPLIKEQLYDALKLGFLPLTIRGVELEVPVRDSFLAFALLQAQLRGYL